MMLHINEKLTMGKWKPVGSIGARIVHTGIPTVCGNTCQTSIANLWSNKKNSILMMSELKRFARIWVF